MNKIWQQEISVPRGEKDKVGLVVFSKVVVKKMEQTPRVSSKVDSRQRGEEENKVADRMRRIGKKEDKDRGKTVVSCVGFLIKGKNCPSMSVLLTWQHSSSPQ